MGRRAGERGIPEVPPSAQAQPHHEQLLRARALLVDAQCEQLDAISSRLGCSLLYLKAAWADPALYGGRGIRMGSDIDILVPRNAFRPFAAALSAAGFDFVCPRRRWATYRYGSKEWTFIPKHNRQVLAVDLHRTLADSPWFSWDDNGSFQRARYYPTRTGYVRSLGVEDQIVYAAAHYANHRYSLDERHLNDVDLLLQQNPDVDWDATFSISRRAGLFLALTLVRDALAARGHVVPTWRAEANAVFRRRRASVSRWVEIGKNLRRAIPVSWRADEVLRLPVLSDRLLALPLYLARTSALLAADALG